MFINQPTYLHLININVYMYHSSIIYMGNIKSRYNSTIYYYCTNYLLWWEVEECYALKKIIHSENQLNVNNALTWSNGHCFFGRFDRHDLHTVCAHPKLMGCRTLTSNPLQHTGHARKSVHCGAWIGIAVR